MIRVVEKKTERDPGYHEYIYKEGKKIPKEKDGLVRCYLAPATENGRMLKATERVDIAGSVDGKFVETDEVGTIGGAPGFGGEIYNIWGIGEGYVITSVRGDKFYVGAASDNKVVTQPNQTDKLAAYTKLYEIYKLLSK